MYVDDPYSIGLVWTHNTTSICCVVGARGVHVHVTCIGVTLQCRSLHRLTRTSEIL